MIFEIPRILLIDSYDSFTYNLAALCRQSIPNCSIYIIKNNDYTVDQLLPNLECFSAVIVGPGPGSPDNGDDIGVVRDLWKIADTQLLPIFGVCLGLQSLGIEFGAKLRRLNAVKHGQVSNIRHNGIDLFDDFSSIRAVRYHSLHIEVRKGGDIEELAWADDEENGRVVMAIKHRTRPFWAVQYHPESVCTDGGGIEVLRNFWRLAQGWSRKHGRRVAPWNAVSSSKIAQSWPYITPHSPPPTPSQLSHISYTTLQLPGLSVVEVCEICEASNNSSQFALLDSAAQPGRFSIVAALMPSSLHITYSVDDSFVRFTRGDITIHEELVSYDIWSWLATFMRSKKACGGPAGVPFWGGLIGYLNYELGVYSLEIPLKGGLRQRNDCHSDVNLIFVERSIVLDSSTGEIFIQSLIPHDNDWISDMAAKLSKASLPVPLETTPNKVESGKCTIILPDKDRYISRIKEAKEHLYSGDSYELCLTAQTHISVSSPSESSWDRYKRLRKNNPAPHSAYLRLHPTTLLCSSPERFLSYSRPPGSVCQLRPIKGTVRKAPGITRAIAEKALAGSTKEVAENLMIVDLIRHDLHGVVGDDVTVKQFCSVEEYETVWQLVSVIEGKLSPDPDVPHEVGDELGWEVLRRSLPPGSMTGAPKKRSVEILQHLEEKERGIYSGVVGYWCVGGGGDWSVIIRSCFKYDEPEKPKQSEDDLNGDNQGAQKATKTTDEWVIGAGGAITALSDPEAEWEEMVTKLQSVLKSFGASGL
ncbi:para-aminobenzoic acid synthetase [Crucibulum laeve]|uniref:aminodeoxychorismate synthase n=1 Tax=Crucibulum laeve TaxID=68775 RepID=A0A5C3LUX1_9AGAR|nr:para-aminobenzoic acid synthetase [Crucibulum laeve]